MWPFPLVIAMVALAGAFGLILLFGTARPGLNLPATAPMAARVTVDGLQPRKAVLGPFLIPKHRYGVSLTLDAIINTLTSGTHTGKQMQNVIRDIKIYKDGRLHSTLEKGTLVALAKWSNAKNAPFPWSALQIAPFAEPTPATSSFHFWTVAGRFSPGSYTIVINFDNVTGELVGCTVLNVSWGAGFMTDERVPGLVYERFVGKKFFAENQFVSPPARDVIIESTLANLVTLSFNGESVGATIVEWFRRMYLMMTGVIYNGTLDANYLPVYFDKPTVVSGTLNAATTTAIVCTLTDAAVPIGGTRGSPRGNPQRGRREASMGGRGWEKQEIHEVDPTGAVVL